MNPRTDDDFVRLAREALDEVALAPDIVGRLAAARRRAVVAADRPVVHAPAQWIPVGALATTLLIVALGVRFDHGAMLPLDDDAQLAAVEDFELLQDLEFVAWLDTANADG